MNVNQSATVMENVTTFWLPTEDWISLELAPNRTKFESMGVVVFNTVIASIILINNSLLLLTLGCTRKLWTSTNAYIASLAGADLLVGLVLVVRNFWIIGETSWVFHENENMCMPFVSLLYVSALESITCLALVSLDRYAYIVWPFWYERHVTNRLTAVSIAVSWLVCIALGFLPMHLNRFSPDIGCDPMAIISKHYLLFCLNLYLMVAEIVIAAMYGRIFCVGNQQRRRTEAYTRGLYGHRTRLKTSSTCFDDINSGIVDNTGKSHTKARTTAIAVVSDVNYGAEGHKHGASEHLQIVEFIRAGENINGVESGAIASAMTEEEEGHKAKQTPIVNQGNESGRERAKRSVLSSIIKFRHAKKYSQRSMNYSSSRWQVIRFLLLVCGIFFMCWVPLQIVVIIYFTSGAPTIAISVTVSIAAINSALNMYVFLAMNRTFKIAFCTLFCRLPCCTGQESYCQWRKDNNIVEFVSDYNPVIKPSLRTESPPSPQMCNSLSHHNTIGFSGDQEVCDIQRRASNVAERL
ncbi:D(2) dopamine receptor [Plakobranchus ocellatus]|uniref:D(2) dopamine receptor n=1 Tax=Plakobranchus ocellatus TaxID=259542 RepID=A0AAV3Z941_9GAST|nr:D(2) dopamine receptor [Plakobranchus ocellatus]